MTLTEDWIGSHVRPLFSGSLREGEVYLANHSLGRPPDAVSASLADAVALWQLKLDECWDDGGWMETVTKFRQQLALLLGVSRIDCVVPKTSAGQGLRAVLNALQKDCPLQVVTTTGEFDSIDFILKSYSEQGKARITWVPASAIDGRVPLFESKPVCDAIQADTDLVVVSAVYFTTGQILQGLDEIVAKAHSVGALCVVDLYHAAGVVPCQVEQFDIDFAIGGCYKYLRGGPGACYLAIHPKHADNRDLKTLDTGWFAKDDTFGYQRSGEPLRKRGGDGWLESTPPILTAYQALPGLDFTLEIGVERLRSYNLAQQATLREAFLSAGASPHVPKNPERYGAFTLLPSEDTKTVVDHLKSQNVTVDARGGFVRFGPDLLNTENEFQKAARALLSK